VTEYLDFEDILDAHDRALQVTPAEPPGILDAGAIAAAVARPQATVFGDDAYPIVWEKAAAMLQSLACNHGFMSANKRTAWLSAVVFLALNDHPLDPTYNPAEVTEFVIAVVEHRHQDVTAIAGALLKFFH
jgi:death on curing protein